MATEAKSTIKSSGGDYTSLSGWISGEQTAGTDLTSRGVYILAECYDDWVSGLDDAFSISGFTTSSTVTPSIDNTTNEDIRITVASGERHDGTPLSGFHIYANDAVLITISNDCYIEWLDVYQNLTSSYKSAVYITSSIDVRLEKCIVKGSYLTGTTARAINSSHNAGTLEIINCLIYNSGVGLLHGNGGIWDVLNCTFADNYYGINVSTITGTNRLVKNTVCYNNATADFTNPSYYASGSTNNASSDSSEPGSNPITTDIVSGDFTAAASDDWSVADTDSTLYDAGADLSGTFSDDIIGTTRSTWDVGAFELAAGGPTLVNIGLASETDTAFAHTSAKEKAIGLASELDTAFTLDYAKAASIGLSTESDTAFAMAHERIKAIGQSLETDSALAIQTGTSQSIGLSTETDTALSVGHAFARSLALAQETDTATAILIGAGVQLGLAAETDTALAVGKAKDQTIGIAQETDSSLLMSVLRDISILLASETDSALAMTSTAGITIGLAAESDSALAMGSSKVLEIGLSAESDSALGISPTTLISIGQAIETDSGFAMDWERAVSMGLASELDTSFVVVPVGAIVVRAEGLQYTLLNNRLHYILRRTN